MIAMSLKRLQSYIKASIIILSAIIFITATPSVALAVTTNSQVPVFDQNQTDVNRNILEQQKQTVEYLKKLWNKESKDDPTEELKAKKKQTENSQETIEDMQTGYPGYLHGRFSQGGEKEESFMADNPSGFLKEIADSEFKRYFNTKYGIPVDSLHGDKDFSINDEKSDVFTQDIVSGITREYSRSKVRDNYTLDDHTGGKENTKAFLNGDFSSGGFTALYHLNANPDNNPMERYIKEKEAVTSQIASNQREEMTKLDWFNGVRAQEDETGRILTPGTIKAEILKRAVTVCDRAFESLDEGVSGNLSVLDELTRTCDEVQSSIQRNGILSENVLTDLESIITKFDINISAFKDIAESAIDEITTKLENEAKDMAQEVVDGFLD